MGSYYGENLRFMDARNVSVWNREGEMGLDQKNKERFTD